MHQYQLPKRKSSFQTSQKTEFFEESYVTLNKALNEYDNLLLAGDLNINANTKSNVKNNYVKWTSRENCVAYKKAKNKCNSLTRKAKRKFSKKLDDV